MSILTRKEKIAAMKEEKQQKKNANSRSAQIEELKKKAIEVCSREELEEAQQDFLECFNEFLSKAPKTKEGKEMITSLENLFALWHPHAKAIHQKSKGKNKAKPFVAMTFANTLVLKETEGGEKSIESFVYGQVGSYNAQGAKYANKVAGTLEDPSYELVVNPAAKEYEERVRSLDSE